MEVMWVLLPLAILLGLAFIAAFVWVTWKGQYDDLDTPQLRMLLDDQTSTLLSPSHKGSAHDTKNCP